MPQTALQNIGINYDWDLGADGWRAGMNFNLAILDQLAQAGLTVAAKSVASQPGSPADGAFYLLPSGLSGAQWSTRSENDLALYTAANGWYFTTPREGWVVYDRASNRYLYFDGSNWVGLRGEPVTVTASSKTPDILEANLLFLLNAASMTFTIPNNSAEPFPVGTKLTAINLNANTALIADGGSVTWLQQDPTAQSPQLQQYEILEVQKLATDQWVVLRREALPA